MKEHKKSILIFALFWVIGITGGYYLGVGSEVLPTEEINYNLYLATTPQKCKVEPVAKRTQVVEKDSDNDSKADYFILLRQFEIDKIPALMVNKMITK